MVVVTVIVGITESKPNTFRGHFVSIVDWNGREVYSCRDVGPLRRTPGTASPKRWLLSTPVTPHGEPQLLGHLRAETLPVVHRILPTVPTELEDGHHNGESKPAQQDHEHSADVLDTERVGLRVLALVLETEREC